MSAQNKCSSCGATGNSLVCSYCGAALIEPDSPQGEMAAVRELQQHVKAASGMECAKLIRSAYFPKNEAALIEAGLMCVPWLDSDTVDEHEMDIEEAAAGRLEGIISKLEIHAESDASIRAVEEFKGHIRRFRARRKTAFWIGLTAFAVIPCALGIVLWWMFT